MFMIGIPGTERWLAKKRGLMKTSARSIFFVFMIVGITEMVGLVGFHTYLAEANPSGFSKIWTAFDRGFGYNDATALTHQAADNLLAGKNPYANSNVVTALLRFNPYSDRVTPLKEGKFANSFPYPTSAQLEQVWEDVIKNPQQIPVEYASNLSYPSGSFLLPIPFMLAAKAAGLPEPDFRIIFTIFVLTALIYVTFLIPGKKRFLFLGLLLISFDLWNSIADGETGSLVFPFLLLAFVLVKRKAWLSGIFMGIAVATKQTAWFFLPFYLIMVFNTSSFKKFGVTALIVAGVFSAMNLPFMVLDIKLWFASIFNPMSGDIYPLGVGVVTLVTGGLLNIQSPFIFDVMEFTVLGLGVCWYFFYYRRYPYLGPVLAVFPLFFAWRSLWPYFFYTVIILLAMYLTTPDSLKGESENNISAVLRTHKAPPVTQP